MKWQNVFFEFVALNREGRTPGSGWHSPSKPALKVDRYTLNSEHRRANVRKSVYYDQCTLKSRRSEEGPGRAGDYPSRTLTARAVGAIRSMRFDGSNPIRQSPNTLFC